MEKQEDSSDQGGFFRTDHLCHDYRSRSLGNSERRDTLRGHPPAGRDRAESKVMSNDVLIGIAANAVGTLVGGLITWIVAYWYFKRSGDELRAEAKELRKLAHLALVVITDPKGRYEPILEAAGLVTGLRVQLGRPRAND